MIFCSSAYRKQGTRAVGNVHLHVDLAEWAQSSDRLVEIAMLLDAEGWPSKVTRVVRAVAGAHMSDAHFAADYAEHTPELSEGLDTFAAYLTAQLSPDAQAAELERIVAVARARIGEVLKAGGVADAVVEIERVCARIEGSELTVAEPVAARWLGNRPPAFEAHHFVDLRYGGAQLEEWIRTIAPLDIDVGGWFQFEKSGYSAFRSVRFYRQLELDHVVRQHQALRGVFDDAKAGPLMRLESVVEQVVDLWRV
ncbi:hypothetical protein P6144_17795 [Sphingomonas sp. HITSZ_GF]|uniref:hypothetical protein n=1 Tax=Sphingomonas sp. HITSZ_GF TaxID=3037247 RepID=UPI00240D6F95|nr:hypothetical protein [Sphingomonas sp. HITSZ_GF]MDG2535520.1 hypothetical protein [Sphingomonas sp. HITSZ_GF]